MTEPEKIMDHEFIGGVCTKCGRKRIDLLSYGHPDVVLKPGQHTGLSCSGGTTETEIESLRQAWRAERDRWDKSDFFKS